MKLTDKLNDLMDEHGINRMELSKNAEIPYTTIIGLYEKGYENAKLSTLRKLSAYFNCSLDYLADDNITDRNFKSPESLMDELKNIDTKWLIVAKELSDSGLSPDDPHELIAMLKYFQKRSDINKNK